MNLSGKYLLDTNVVIALFAGDLMVKEKVRNAEYIVAAPPVIGELALGHRSLIELRKICVKLTY